MELLASLINTALQKHLKRYYSGKIVHRIEARENLVGEPIMRRVYFSDRTYHTFLPTDDLRRVWRHPSYSGRW